MNQTDGKFLVPRYVHQINQEHNQTIGILSDSTFSEDRFPVQSEVQLVSLYLYVSRLHEMYGNGGLNAMEERSYNAFVNAIGWHDTSKMIWDIVNKKTYKELSTKCTVLTMTCYGIAGFLNQLCVSASQLYHNMVKKGRYTVSGQKQYKNKYVLPEYKTTKLKEYKSYVHACKGKDTYEYEQSSEYKEISFYSYPLASRILARIHPKVMARIANGELDTECWIPKFKDSTTKNQHIAMNNLYYQDYNLTSDTTKEKLQVSLPLMLQHHLLLGGIIARSKPTCSCGYKCINPFHYGKVKRMLVQSEQKTTKKVKTHGEFFNC
tara:strand:- start:1177 stop:2139 length:963 start_codon:yes stop_codon:yes gene_type:complete